jgi:hypothetical protein
MRFMMLVKANKDSEAGVLPDENILSEMAKYNEELVKAGARFAPACSPVFILGSAELL